MNKKGGVLFWLLIIGVVVLILMLNETRKSSPLYVRADCIEFEYNPSNEFFCPDPEFSEECYQKVVRKCVEWE